MSRPARIGMVAGWMLVALCFGRHELLAQPLIKRPPAIRVAPGVQVQAARAAVQPEPGEEVDAAANLVPADRELLQALSRARRRVDEGRFGEAVRDLGEILLRDVDGFVPGGAGEARLRFLKAETLTLLGSLPPAAREAYELQFGADAARSLAEAVEQGDFVGLERVVRLYFHTKAGYEAVYLLGMHHLDQGRSLAAALSWERLAQLPDAAERFQPRLSLLLAIAWLNSDRPDRAQAVLAELKSQHPKARFVVAGKSVPLFKEDDQALPWLKQLVAVSSSSAAFSDNWLMYRGTPGRTASSQSGRPLFNLRWAMRTYTDSTVLTAISESGAAYQDQNSVLMPASAPLAVGNIVLMRTLDQLLAVNFETGKRMWPVPSSSPIEARVAAATGAARAQDPTAANSLEQRVWMDMTFGTMSCDGEQVYLIEGIGRQQMVIHRTGRRQYVPSQRMGNRLSAHELATEGKTRWTLGGPADEDDVQEAGTFFLGPPLPLAGRLYVLAETRGVIRLLAIDPRKDPFRKESLVEWSQPLAGIEGEPLEGIGTRRFLGLSPSYADGVLVCPTGAGVVVAVDLANRSLLWGRAHGGGSSNLSQQRMMMRAGIFQEAQLGTDGWNDASVVVAQGHVLLAQPESDRLFCLRLADGEKLWEVERGDGVYVAGVEQGVVLVVAKSGVAGYRLADGQPAWPRLDHPSGALPSGRGFFSSGRYYLPLTSAEVAMLDVPSGQLVQRIRSRHGVVPGNLIPHGDAILSQGPDQLYCFDQAEAVERLVAANLEKNPDDPSALQRSGELQLDQGNLVTAVDQLRRALEKQSDPHTRELLAEALTEWLRTDYAAHRDAVSELESLLDRPAQWYGYLRVRSDGLRQLGDNRGAFESLLKIGELKLDGPTQRLPHEAKVRPDRWLRARLQQTWSAASSEERGAMDELVASRLESAQAAGAEGLRTFLKSFDAHPLAEQARERLLGQLGERDGSLEMEILLRRMMDDNNPARAATATLRLAEFYERHARPHLVAWCYELLGSRFAELVVRDGKTGKQLAEVRAKEPWASQDRGESRLWPRGVVELDRKPAQGHNMRTMIFDTSATEDPATRRVGLELNNQAMVLLRDALGRQQWQLPLAPLLQNNAFAFQNQGFNKAQLRGSLALVSLGHTVAAIDMTQPGGANAAERAILWKVDLSGQPETNRQFFGWHHRQDKLPWGETRAMITDHTGRMLGDMGPLSGHYVALQRRRNLVAYEPLTGETLWEYKSLEPNCQLFGDEELVVAVPREGNRDGEAVLVSAIDGTEVARRTVPGARERMATLGRTIIAWSMQGGKVIVRRIDPLDEKELWRHTFDAGARGAVLERELCAVVQIDGKFSCFSLDDGKVEIEAQLGKDAYADEIRLVGSADTLTLITSRQPQAGDGHFQPVPHSYTRSAPVNGRVFGFDRTTRAKVWDRKIERQGIMLDQSPGVPVLVFGAVEYTNNKGQQQTVSRLLCLDKRTGRVLHQEETSQQPQLQLYDLTARPSDGIVELRTTKEMIVMKFTDEPVPDEPEQDAAKPGADEKSPDEKPADEQDAPAPDQPDSAQEKP